MNKFKTLTTLCLLFIIQACAQNQTKDMETLIAEIHKNVHSYKTRPVYSVQVNKAGCRFVLEMKDYRDYRFTEDDGESMNLPLNFFITKSGRQCAIIKIYPRKGETYISKAAMLNLVFYRAPDKDSKMNDYKEIAHYKLPTDLGTQQLPYYEAFVEFNADVPYIHAAELETAQNLTQIADIEAKVVQAYQKRIDVILSKNFFLYEQSRLRYLINYYDVNYATLDEIRTSENDPIAMFDNRLEDREMLPIENYYLQYYAQGKIVALWNKADMENVLRIKGRIKNKAGIYRDVRGADPLYLYMPKGSNELKVW